MPTFDLYRFEERVCRAYLHLGITTVLAYRVAREETPTLARAVAESVARRARLIRKGARR